MIFNIYIYQFRVTNHSNASNLPSLGHLGGWPGAGALEPHLGKGRPCQKGAASCRGMKL